MKTHCIAGWRNTVKISAVLISAGTILSLTGCAPDYSSGSRAGVVTKLSNKGLIWKSWEGELNMGGVKTVQSSGSTYATEANVFTFNVTPEAVNKVKAALVSGDRVELVYQECAIAPPTIENDHVVIAVNFTN